MSKHVVIIMAVMLVASTGYTLPRPTPQITYATEAELLSIPGSAGYLVDGEFTAGDEAAVPLCDCEEDEGEWDEGEDGAEPDPGDGGADGGGEDWDEGSDDDDDDVGC